MLLGQLAFPDDATIRLNILNWPTCAESVHLAPKTVDTPGCAKDNAQILRNSLDIGLCDRPVHFPVWMPSVNIMENVFASLVTKRTSSDARALFYIFPPWLRAKIILKGVVLVMKSATESRNIRTFYCSE